MKIRPYQSQAVENIYKAWQTDTSTLLVLPTGCGKTICFAEVINRSQNGRAIVIAHREELLWQAKQKIRAVTGHEASVEMAEYRADRHSLFKSHVVVASVQTLIAGTNERRMKQFDPFEFGILICDEAHHITAASYRAVLDHFKQNPNLRILGVTATPDRTDEEALGQVFDSVAFDYEILDAINDGWLCQIEQHSVAVDGLDLSSVRTTAGDLNGADLAQVMEYEQNLHEIASPTIDLTRGRKTLVFAASVAHAERLCEIFNRHSSECARWVCGETPKESRRQMFDDYSAGKFQFMVNVGVLTEGFDDPSIQCIVMARPTKSRALFAQMAGRGTRPLPGLVDGLDTPMERCFAIRDSAKPFCEIIDFVGNSGKHKLASVADILGGNYPEEIVELAATRAREAGKSLNISDTLKEAEQHILREKEKAIEAARRAAIRARANYSTQKIDPFDIFQIAPVVERGWDKDKQPTEKMLALLDKQGIPTDGLNFSQAKRLIAEITGRWDQDKCSFKQAKLLRRYGLSGDVSRTDAKLIIDQIAQNNWKLPADLSPRREPVEVF